LNTLTKILVLLLTAASIFLCGIVVTYVSVSDNYKQKYETAQRDMRSLKLRLEGEKQDLQKQVETLQAQEDTLNGQIAMLQQQLMQLQGELANAKAQNDMLLQKVNSWTSVVQDSTRSEEKLTQLLQNTQSELKTTQAELIKLKKDNEETSIALLEKMAIIDSLTKEKRRLQEEKADLEKQLAKYLQPAGKQPVAAKPVTPRPGPVREAPRAKDIALQGRITAVDLRNQMASISIGSADGVAKGMKFYVTRGDRFVCEIHVTDVDVEESVGTLKLMQYQPQVGDTASTNL